MLSKLSNIQCPYCGQHKVEVITAIDPMSFNYHEVTKTICTFCGKVIEPTEKVTYSNSSDHAYTSAGSAYKYCTNCNTKMEPLGDSGWWSCPKCGYGYREFIGDPKQFSDEDIEISKKIFEGKLHTPCDNVWGVGKILPNDLTEQNTLTITNCEKIKMHHKEIAIDFEFDIPKIENINTIIINGHKFVREKSE